MEETVTIGGVDYTLRDPGHLALMNAAKAFIVRDRPNPLVEAAQAIASLPANLPPDARVAHTDTIERIATGAMLARNRVTAQDVGMFLFTREGMIFAFWQFCPQVPTFDKAAEIVEQMFSEMGEEQAKLILQAKIDTASGMAAAKNSSGPAQKSTTGREESDQNPDSDSGENRNSTSTSPQSTDSDAST